MEPPRRIVLRLLALFRSRALDRDLDEELDAHLALAADEHVRRGLSPDEARRHARLELGGVDAARERHRDARGLPLLDELRQDLAFAVRTCRRSPAFTALAVLILALGTGVNTAVFSIVSPLMLRPLPFEQPDRLVWVSPDFSDGRSSGTYRVGVFEEMKRRAQSFSELSAYFAFSGYVTYTLTGQGPAQALAGTMVAPRFFETLGVRPAAGRLFSASESEPIDGNAAAVPAAIVISHAFWQRRFAANPALVGDTITINGRPATVVGVLPASFDFGSVFAPTTRVDFFLPAPLAAMHEWGDALAIVGRLRPGASVESARSEIDTLVPQITNDRPELGRITAAVTGLATHVSGRFRRSLAFLWGAVSVVLLIACANLSNLLMARTTARAKEIGIRVALGAGRARMIRQLLTEGALLSLAGAACGLPLAYGITQYVKGTTTLAVPLMTRVEIDGFALAFTAVIAVAAGLASTMLAALRIPGEDREHVLMEHTRTPAGGRAQIALRSALVISEISLACVLLVGAGLLTRSLLEVLDNELGFEPSHAVAVRLNLSNDWSPEGRAHRDGTIEALMNRIRGVPGVEAAGVTDALPLDRSRGWNVIVPGLTDSPNQAPGAFVYVTGPGYLAAMGIPVRAGRDFTLRDIAPETGSVIVNEPLAARLWPGQNPLGRTLRTAVPGTFTVVGVVADVRQGSVEGGRVFQMYLPYTQVPPGTLDLVIRSTLPPAGLASGVRAALSSIDRDLMSSELRPVQDLVDRSVSPRRFLANLIGGFSLLALVLACLGVYAVVSFAVSRRVHEIGVRMAIGATARDVRREIVSGTLRLAVAGIAIGSVASLGLARLLAGLLYETSPADPMTFAGTALVLIAVALAAAYLPARRAARIDPIAALRV